MLYKTILLFRGLPGPPSSSLPNLSPTSSLLWPSQIIDWWCVRSGVSHPLIISCFRHRYNITVPLVWDRSISRLYLCGLFDPNRALLFNGSQCPTHLMCTHSFITSLPKLHPSHISIISAVVSSSSHCTICSHQNQPSFIYNRSRSSFNSIQCPTRIITQSIQLVVHHYIISYPSSSSQQPVPTLPLISVRLAPNFSPPPFPFIWVYIR
jgi:hypothetical protein